MIFVSSGKANHIDISNKGFTTNIIANVLGRFLYFCIFATHVTDVQFCESVLLCFWDSEDISRIVKRKNISKTHAMV